MLNFAVFLVWIHRIMDELDVKHIAVVIPPAAVGFDGDRIGIGDNAAAGLNSGKLLGKFGGMLAAVFSDKIEIAAAIVVGLEYCILVQA